MSFLTELGRRVWYLLRRRHFDALLRQEMESHRAMLGDPRRFGRMLQLREQAQDVWGWGWLDALLSDLRFAIRGLRRARGFSLAVVISLTLGLTAAAIAVAVANAYLVQPLPYAAAERLYHVMYAPPGPWEPAGVAALDWTAVSDVVESPITARGDTFYLVADGEARAARALRVTSAFVSGLGVSTLIGRPLQPADFAAGGGALIGYALWRDRYHSSPNVLGTSITIRAESRNGARETWKIVGVLRPDFYFGRDSTATVDVLVPMSEQARTYMVRLREGVQPALAVARLSDAVRAVARELPPDWPGVRLESVRARYVAQVRPIVLAVLIAVALVLMIVLANVAILIVLHTLRRQREFAVRAALGSSRWHLVRLLALENLLVCAAGAAAALWLTNAALDQLAPRIAAQLGRPAPRGLESIAVDGTVTAVIAALTLAFALALTSIPLTMERRRHLGDTLRRDTAGATGSRSMQHLRSALIACEVAGTLVLVIACAVMVRTVLHMMSADLGYDPRGLTRTRVVLRAANYPQADSYLRFYEHFSARVLAGTGRAPVFTSWPPFIEPPDRAIETEGRQGPAGRAGFVAVGPGHFQTLGTTVRDGREFGRGDRPGAEPVAVVSETLARQLWPREVALGRRIRILEPTPGGIQPGAWRTVVGVAADVRHTYGDGNLSDVYVPTLQGALGRFGSFYLRTDAPSHALQTTLRRLLHEVDADAVLDDPRRVDDENRELAGVAFVTTMLGGFVVVAAFLAVIGIYGVTSYAARQRRREIAIRVALGASRRTIVRQFVREGAPVLIGGLSLGACGAVAALRLIEAHLAGVARVDLGTTAAVTILLGAAGGLATWWPARRAAADSPVVALRDA